MSTTANLEFINKGYYRCVGDNKIYLYMNGSMYLIQDINAYRALGSPTFAEKSCDILNSVPKGTFNITKDNAAAFKAGTLPFPPLTPQEELQEDISVSIFKPGTYYSCNNMYFYINSNSTKAMVTNEKTLADIKAGIIVSIPGNCQALDKVAIGVEPNPPPLLPSLPPLPSLPALPTDMGQTFALLGGGVSICLFCMVLLIIIIYFAMKNR